jgi:hypothetical protein
LGACGPRAHGQKAREPDAALPDVRVASGRPPVVLVLREGDPATAVAIAVTTAGIGFTADTPADDPEPATALAGVIEARLEQRGIDAVVTPAWDGVRASALATNEAEAVRVTESLRDALAAKVEESDLAGARRKLTALGERPLRDRALGRWARCVGQPYALPERAGKDYADLDVLRLERWRAQAAGLGRVAVAVTGPPAIGEAAARAILRGPIWKEAQRRTSVPSDPAATVFEGNSDSVVAHVTLDVGTSSAAVTTAEALGDPHGPLAARLSELDLPFHLREVTGAAHASGGCVGVVLASGSQRNSGGDLAAHVADAIALVQLEANVFLGERAATRDGRLLARRSGDAREAAERAAWWALVDRPAGPRATDGSVALGLPLRHAAPLERDALATSVAHARAAWDKPVIDARTRVEAGQGEAWVLVGSPCGTEGEADDSGLSALFVTAAADAMRAGSDVSVEPWVAADGAGLLVHGPPLAGETAPAHARRLADVAARGFAAEPITGAAIGHARSDLLRRDTKNDGATLSLLASVLAPQHPSWIVPWGASEPLARSADGAVLLRAQALRSGPVRIAMLANADAAQAAAAVRAADRWVARHSGEARGCRPPAAAPPPKPGTYSMPSRPGALPEAYLAFPLPAGDAAARNGAQLVVAALGDGLLERTLLLDGKDALAYEASARVLGWPRAPALVIRVVASQAALDGAVMQTRALVDRIRQNGLPELDRATNARSRLALTAALDPRARVVATWRAETASAPVSVDEARAFTQRYLAEDAMVVVAARPPRPAP